MGNVILKFILSIFDVCDVDDHMTYGVAIDEEEFYDEE